MVPNERGSKSQRSQLTENPQRQRYAQSHYHSLQTDERAKAGRHFGNERFVNAVTGDANIACRWSTNAVWFGPVITTVGSCFSGVRQSLVRSCQWTIVWYQTRLPDGPPQRVSRPAVPAQDAWQYWLQPQVSRPTVLVADQLRERRSIQAAQVAVLLSVFSLVPKETQKLAQDGYAGARIDSPHCRFGASLRLLA